MSRKTNAIWWIVAAMGLGFVLRLAFILNAARIAGDTLLYGDIAKNWMHAGVYGFAQSNAVPIPTLIRLPGYPLFLVLCFGIFGPDHYTQVMIVQCFIDLATCLLVGDLARRIFGIRAGMLALWLGALCPFTANYVAAPLTEALSLFCIALAFYSLERWRESNAGWNIWILSIGFALAYALLLRPEQALLTVAILPAMFWMSAETGFLTRRSAPVLAVMLVVVLPLVPWTIRNWQTFHVIQPLAPRYATDPGETVPLGFQRWYKSWAIDFASTENVYWNWDSNEIDIREIPSRAFDSNEQYKRTASLLAVYNRDSNATPQLDHAFDALAAERIASNPLRYYVALPVARLVNMLLRPRTEMLEVGLAWWRWQAHPGKSLFAALYALVNLAYLLLGLTGLWRWRGQGWTPIAYATLGFVLLRCAMLLTLDNSEPRYTLEFFPVFIFWAAALATQPNSPIVNSGA